MTTNVPDGGRVSAPERAAWAEISRFEARFGAITSPHIPVERFAEDLWECHLLYIGPEELGIPADARGALLPDRRVIVVSDRLRRKEQQNAAIAHEGGHWVLHVPPDVRDRPREEEASAAMSGSASSFFCRAGSCERGGAAEPYWMYREAERFAACLMLPRRTFVARARQRVVQAWREKYRDCPFPGPAWFRHVHIRAAIGLRDRAAHLLHQDYESEVSEPFIRIRLCEVGLAPDEKRATSEPEYPGGDLQQILADPALRRRSGVGMAPLHAILDAIVPAICAHCSAAAEADSGGVPRSRGAGSRGWQGDRRQRRERGNGRAA